LEVGERNLVIAVALEQVNEIRRTLPPEIVDANMRCWVYSMQVAAQPPFNCVLSDRHHRYLLALHAGGRAARQEEVHRLQNLATGEGWQRATADQQRLVNVGAP